MDIYNNSSKKVIAFYLPQFHTIPENDKWWGEGFTEWTNTKKAQPLFEGHLQPNTPLNENYYDLSDVTVMEKQAQLAKRYGIFGFCYYHYWFKDGKKLLEKPVEQMLKDKRVDMPFCMCWANENWSRNWDGGNREILMQQDYGTVKDWKKHFMYLLQFFRDERYIKYDNAPVLLIYKPEEIGRFNAMISAFKHFAVKAGFRDLIVISQYPTVIFDPDYKDLMIDYKVAFQPVASDLVDWYSTHKVSPLKKSVISGARKLHIYETVKGIKKKLIKDEHLKALRKIDYDKAWDIILNKMPSSPDIINGGFTAWDNTPRSKTGTVYVGASSQKFEDSMTKLLKKPSALDLVFVNAWNEWAEGAYLEPDERYGYAYLQALKNAVENQ